MNDFESKADTLVKWLLERYNEYMTLSSNELAFMEIPKYCVNERY